MARSKLKPPSIPRHLRDAVIELIDLAKDHGGVALGGGFVISAGLDKDCKCVCQSVAEIFGKANLQKGGRDSWSAKVDTAKNSSCMTATEDEVEWTIGGNTKVHQVGAAKKLGVTIKADSNAVGKFTLTAKPKKSFKCKKGEGEGDSVACIPTAATVEITIID